jgi:hypothetical protein
LLFVWYGEPSVLESNKSLLEALALIYSAQLGTAMMDIRENPKSLKKLGIEVTGPTVFLFVRRRDESVATPVFQDDKFATLPSPENRGYLVDKINTFLQQSE